MSHLDGVVATKLIDMLIGKGHVTMDDITCVYHKRLEAGPELLYQVCEGFIELHHTYCYRQSERILNRRKPSLQT